MKSPASPPREAHIYSFPPSIMHAILSKSRSSRRLSWVMHGAFDARGIKERNWVSLWILRHENHSNCRVTTRETEISRLQVSNSHK